MKLLKAAAILKLRNPEVPKEKHYTVRYKKGTDPFLKYCTFANYKLQQLNCKPPELCSNWKKIKESPPPGF